MKKMKFIWGIKSWDDLSGRKCDLYTLNDFDIYYDTSTKSYHYGVETIYNFEDEDDAVKYLKAIYREFTKWMRKNGYKTDREPSLFDVFGERKSSGFETIEELYADFKLKCMGFALMRSKKKGN